MTPLLDLAPVAPYLAVAIGAALDHTGVPTALILSTGAAASGLLDIKTVLVANFLGAFAGDVFLYVLGRFGGRSLVLKGARRLSVSEARIESAEALVAKHGATLVLFGRYYLLVGRYVPLVCGAANMPFRRFAGYSAVGLVALTLLVGLAIYSLGQSLNGIAQNPLTAMWICVAGVGLQLGAIGFGLTVRRIRNDTRKTT